MHGLGQSRLRGRVIEGGLTGGSSGPGRFRRSGRRGSTLVLPGLLVAVLGVAAYHRALTPGLAIANHDLFFWIHPYYSYLAEAWRQGRWLPLWNPGIFLGAPFLANIQVGALYPPNLLLAVLPVTSAVGWLVALHTALAGAGMYAYAARACGISRTGSAVAGIVYMLNSYVVSHVGQLNLVEALAWTPWLMLATDRLAYSYRPQRVAAVAACVALVILAGHPQQSYFGFILAIAAGASRLWRVGLAQRAWPRAARQAALLAGAAALGAGLAALQLAATGELTGHSIRSGGLSLAASGVQSLPFRDLNQNLLGEYGGEHRAELTASAGAAAMPLIALALVTRWRRPRVWLWVLVAMAALAAAFGPKLRFYDLLYLALPGFNLFRVPARTLFFTTLVAALLAGEGTQAAQLLAVAFRRPAWRRRVTACLALAAALSALPALGMLALHASSEPRHVLLYSLLPPPDQPTLSLFCGFEGASLGLLLAGVLRRRLALGGLPLIVFADLLLLNGHTYAMNPLPESLYQQQPSSASLLPRNSDQRYLALVQGTGSLPVAKTPSDLAEADRGPYLGFARELESLPPNLSMGLQSMDADGYDGGVLPTRSYVDFRRPLLPPGSTNRPDYTDRLLTGQVWDPAWLQLAAVDTVLTAEGANPNPPGSTYLGPASSGGGLTAWKPATAASRARLEDGAGAPVVADTGERVTVRLPAGASGRLLLADAYYPGWTATVDGRPANVQRYAGYTRAVSVPPGAREVTFDYRPAWLLPALAVNALACLLTLGLAVSPIASAARRRTPSQPSPQGGGIQSGRRF